MRFLCFRKTLARGGACYHAPPELRIFTVPFFAVKTSRCGPVRCDFLNLETLRCGAVRRDMVRCGFSVLETSRCGALRFTVTTDSSRCGSAFPVAQIAKNRGLPHGVPCGKNAVRVCAVKRLYKNVHAYVGFPRIQKNAALEHDVLESNARC